ncbi:DUF58 domain-containing protein [Flavobacteriales bacterium]|nr:DUF58 domain-containing protein [Flavobacteriales bacterium]
MDNINQIKLSNNIEFFARQVVEGFITGKHKSPYHGFSVEFAEHRLYNSGESTRHIDWKLFARSDKLFVKRFEEETNLRCHLVLDTSSSMYYPNFNEVTFDKPNKILFSVYASAVLMNIFKKQRDAVGISTFSDEIETHILAKSSNRHHQLIYQELENVLSINAKLNNRKTSTISSLHEIAERINQRSLVFMFTDMISNDNDLEKTFDAIKHLKHKKHEIVLFYVSDVGSEHFLEFDNKPYNFIDVESGDSIKLNPSHYKEDYLKRIGEFLDKLRLKCLQYKIDLVEVDINKGYDQIITSYLLKRQKMF